MRERILETRAITGIKGHIEKTINYARYKTGSTYHKVPIHRKEYLGDGKLVVYFSITPQAANDVSISEVQLFDTEEKLWATKAENILIRSVQEGVLYRFSFDITEV